jgi:hypothetical protein
MFPKLLREKRKISVFLDEEFFKTRNIVQCMVFSKTFPREIEGSNFPRWEEMFLSAQEEREMEQIARQEYLYLIRQCMADARNVLKDESMMDTQSHVLGIALALFKKRSNHAVFYKEDRCKEKFLKYWGKFKHKTEKASADKDAEKGTKTKKKAS